MSGSCAECESELPAGAGREREGLLYCKEDFNRLFVLCDDCGGPFAPGQQRVQALGKQWHAEHFRCKHCRQPFPDGRVFEHDGDVFCEADFTDLFATRCGGCGEVVRPGEPSFVAMGKTWHSNHLTCLHCSCVLRPGDSFFQRGAEGQVYCEADFLDLFCEPCAACGERILGEFVQAAGRRYHPEHLRCHRCNDALSGTIFVIALQPHCEACRDLHEAEPEPDEPDAPKTRASRAESGGHYHQAAQAVVVEADELELDDVPEGEAVVPEQEPEEPEEPEPEAAGGEQAGEPPRLEEAPQRRTSARRRATRTAIRVGSTHDLMRHGSVDDDAGAPRTPRGSLLRARGRGTFDLVDEEDEEDFFPDEDELLASYAEGDEDSQRAESPAAGGGAGGESDEDGSGGERSKTPAHSPAAEEVVVHEAPAVVHCESEPMTDADVVAGAVAPLQPVATSLPMPRPPSPPAEADMAAEWEKVRVLQAYVPDLVLRDIETGSLGPDPHSETCDCAAVLADISGFTRLSETLCDQGDRGIETLSRVLNDYFDRMIELIHSHGGDVVKFAGDALLVVWRDAEGDSAPEGKEADEGEEEKGTPPARRPSARPPPKKRIQRMDALNPRVIQRRVSELVPKPGLGGHGHAELTRASSSFDMTEATDEDEAGERVGSVRLDDQMRQLLHSGTAIEVLDNLSEVTLRAVQCCLALIGQLDGHNELRLHIGVGSGQLLSMHVGGQRDRWEFLLTGGALAQMGEAEAEAESGEVCVSADSWRRIKSHCIGSRQRNGAPRANGVVRVVSVTAPLRTVAGSGRLAFGADGRPALSPTQERVGAAAQQDILFRYVPGAIRAHLQSGHHSTMAGGIGEFRRVTIIFCNLTDVDTSLPELDILALLHEALNLMQISLYAFEGSLRQFIVDDKGTTLIAVFGLKPFAHANDPLLAVRCALDMHAKLQEFGLRSTIGLTSGTVFAGKVGSERRCEYAVIGDVVNLAARLMVAACRLSEERGEPVHLLADDDTYRSAREGVRFEPMPAQTVKGKAHPIAVWHPVGEAQQASAEPRTKLIGHADALHTVQQAVERLEDDEAAPGSVVVLEGPLGIGKSRVLHALRQWARDRAAVELFVGAADEMETMAPYFAFRRVLTRVLHLQTGDAAHQELAMSSPTAQRRMEQLVELHDHADSLRERLPLVAEALPTADVVDNVHTRALSGEARTDATLGLLVALLNAQSQLAPTVLALENAQWFDASTWSLLLMLARFTLREHWRLALLVTMRPLPAGSAKKHKNLVKLLLLREEGLRLEQLGSLSSEDTARLLCAQWGVPAHRLPANVADFVYQRTQGNPLYAGEVATALIDSDVVTLSQNSDGSKSVAFTSDSTDSIDLPETLHAIVISRVDRLSPVRQWVLKLAAIVGGANIELSTLHHLLSGSGSGSGSGSSEEVVTPADLVVSDLADDLAFLTRADLLMQVQREPERTYAFKHSIVQLVAYSSMLFEQRCALHAKLAAFYEGQLRGTAGGGAGTGFQDPEWYQQRAQAARTSELAQQYGRIAYHAHRAGQAGDKTASSIHHLSTATEYLEKAANIALRSYAWEQVIAYLEEAMEVDALTRGEARFPSSPLPDDLFVRRAKWGRVIGEAHVNLGRQSLAREYFVRALRFQGRPVPEPDSAAVSKWNVELQKVIKTVRLKQLLKRPNLMGNPSFAGLFEAVRSYLDLAKVHMGSTSPELGLKATLHALKLALRPAGPSPELAQGYAYLGFYASCHLLQPAMARKASDMAIALSRSSGEPESIAETLLLIAKALQGTAAVDSARQCIDQALIITEDLRNVTQLRRAKLLRADLALVRGELEEAAALYDDVGASGGNVAVCVQQRIGVAWVEMTRGLSHELLRKTDLVEQLVAEVEEDLGVGAQLAARGLVAYGRLYRGNLQKEFLAHLSEMLLRARVTEFTALLGFITTIHVHLTILLSEQVYGGGGELDVNLQRLFELGYGGGLAQTSQVRKLRVDAAEIKARCDQLIRVFKNATAVFPVAHPIYKRLKAVYMTVDDRPRQAVSRWREAAQFSEKYDNATERVLALYDLGRYAELGSAAREETLTTALALAELHGMAIRADIRAEIAVRTPADVEAFAEHRNMRRKCSMLASYVPAAAFKHLGNLGCTAELEVLLRSMTVSHGSSGRHDSVSQEISMLASRVRPGSVAGAGAS